MSSSFSDRITHNFFWRNGLSSVLAVGVIFGLHTGWKSWEEKRSIGEFDTTIYVYAASEGDQPLIDYTRIIREDHTGTWYVQVRRPGVIGYVCKGSGPGNYTTDSTGTVQVDLDWYVGKDCALKPGTYYLHTRWELSDEQGNKKTYVRRSNTFEITRNSQ